MPSRGMSRWSRRSCCCRCFCCRRCRRRRFIVPASRQRERPRAEDFVFTVANTQLRDEGGAEREIKTSGQNRKKGSVRSGIADPQTTKSRVYPFFFSLCHLPPCGSINRYCKCDHEQRAKQKRRRNNCVYTRKR